jgi:hypothetical protein
MLGKDKKVASFTRRMQRAVKRNKSGGDARPPLGTKLVIKNVKENEHHA